MATGSCHPRGSCVYYWHLLVSTTVLPFSSDLRLTLQLFRFGWTGFTPTVHWAVPTAAGIFIGFGVLCVFLPCFNYLVDAYLPL